MTYTCTKEFTVKDRVFLKGEKINKTEYIALTAEERRNFTTDFVPIKARK